MSIRYTRDEDPRPREAVLVAPGLRRLLCDNPGPFTHTGTNTWIIGEGAVAVLDPGPADPAQLDAILRATAGERIERILVSHTHRDHSPGASALAAATGAPTAGFGPHATPPEAGGEGGDHGFHPDQRIADGEAVEGEGWRLRAMHTPGHCANHLCFLGEDALAGVLLSADHAMTWSSSVVSPPDGDMGDYVASLDRLRAGTHRLMLPGHGPPLADPGGFLDALAAHRMQRDARVLDALRAAPGSSAAALVPAAYGEALEERLRPAAARSLLSHLLWAERRALAGRDGERWFAA